MRYFIKKDVVIEASHVLDGMPEGHQCKRLHGHSWQVSVEISAPNLDDKGMVLDFGIIGAYVKQFDHQHLNQFFTPPTSEVFCQVLVDGIEKDVIGPLNRGSKPAAWVRLESVTIKETANSTTSLRREG